MVECHSVIFVTLSLFFHFFLLTLSINIIGYALLSWMIIHIVLFDD